MGGLSFLSFPGSGLLHFLLVESRMIVIYYTAHSRLLSNVAWQSLTKRIDWVKWDVHKFKTVKDVFKQKACAKAGIQEAMWSLDLHFESPNGCYRNGETTAPNILGYLNIGTLLVVAMFVVVCCVGLIRANPGMRFDSPQYCAWSWRLEKTQPYRIFAVLLIINTAVNVVIGGVVVGSAHDGNLSAVKSLLQGSLFEIIALFMTAVALLHTPTPAWNWDGLTFQKCVLDRTGVDPVGPTPKFWESNDQFASGLENALLLSRRGKSEHLHAMLLNYSDIGNGLIDPADPLLKEGEAMLP